MDYFKIYIFTASSIIYLNLFKTVINQRKIKNIKKDNIK